MRTIRIHRPVGDGLRDTLERDLNPSQRAAATAPDGFNLILAGPGSGKTRVITYRVAWLVDREPTDTLVLSTIHQAKGLEWQRVYVPRLVEDSFPSFRALDEPGGEDEERRIFFVAVSRAMDELFLTYLLLLGRGPRGPSMITTPSRFLREVPQDLIEPAQVESDAVGDGSFAPAPRPD